MLDQVTYAGYFANALGVDPELCSRCQKEWPNQGG